MLSIARLTFAVAFLASYLTLVGGSSAMADEFIIHEKISDSFEIGDFKCAPSLHDVNSIELNPATTEMTAGELWRFFHEQGMKKVDKLTICMDVDPESRADVDFKNLVLTIKDTDNSNLQSFHLDRNGDHSMVVPGYEVSGYKPEAELEIQLGYDFMERFSETSTEKVVVNFQMADQSSSAPVFSIAGTHNWMSTPNLGLLAGFILFWLVVFLLMFKFVKPTERDEKTNQPVAT